MEPQVQAISDRVVRARQRLREAPISNSHEVGPPDPKTGERWDRFNVLGHTAEMLPYWSAQLAACIKTGGEFGRAPGSAQRLEGIESGRLLGEPQLRDRIETGTESLLAFVATLVDSDLERDVVHNTRGVMKLREALEMYLVGHLEEHCTQLAQLR